LLTTGGQTLLAILFGNQQRNSATEICLMLVQLLQNGIKRMRVNTITMDSITRDNNMTAEDSDNRGGTTEMNEIYIIYISIPTMADDKARNIII